MSRHKVIKGKCLEDNIGRYLGYCNNPRHIGVVRYSQYRICEKRECKHYERFRPEIDSILKELNQRNERRREMQRIPNEELIREAKYGA